MKSARRRIVAFTGLLAALVQQSAVADWSCQTTDCGAIPAPPGAAPSRIGMELEDGTRVILTEWVDPNPSDPAALSEPRWILAWTSNGDSSVHMSMTPLGPFMFGPVSLLPPGDVNADNRVDMADLWLAIEDLGRDYTFGVRSDLTADGLVTVSDLSIIFNHLDENPDAPPIEYGTHGCCTWILDGTWWRRAISCDLICTRTQDDGDNVKSGGGGTGGGASFDNPDVPGDPPNNPDPNLGPPSVRITTLNRYFVHDDGAAASQFISIGTNVFSCAPFMGSCVACAQAGVNDWQISGADYHSDLLPDGMHGSIWVTTNSPPGPIHLSVSVPTGHCGTLTDSKTLTPVYLNLRFDANSDGQLTIADECEYSYLTEGLLTGPTLTFGPTSDIDNDGWPDFADGFNLVPDEVTTDDQVEGRRFIPLELTVSGISDSEHRVGLRAMGYGDPLDVAITPEGEFVLPPNTLARLWKHDGSESLDPRPVWEGGDLVLQPASGDLAVFERLYTFAELGLPPEGGTVTLYIEPIISVPPLRVFLENSYSQIWAAELVNRPSCDPVEADGIDLISALPIKIDLLARGYGETQFVATDRLQTCGPLDHNFPPETTGLLNSSYAINKIQVRGTIGLTEPPPDRCWINGVELPLTPLPDNPYILESPEFIAVNPDDEGPFPDRFQIPVAPDQEWVRISLDGPGDVRGDDPASPLGPRKIEIKTYPKLLPVSADDNLIAAEIERITREMETAQWTPPGWDPARPQAFDGHFGQEVHRQLAQTLNGRPGWMAEVWVNPDTREIVSIGQRPDSLTGRRGIDVMRLQPGYSPVVGDILDLDRVVVAHEIKASLTAQLDTGQRQFYKNFFGAQKFRTTNAPRLWTPQTGWKVGEAFSVKISGLRGIKAVGVIATATGVVVVTACSAIAIVNHEQYDDQFRQVAAAFSVVQHRIADGDGFLQVYGEMVVYADALAAYMRNFTPPGTDVNIVVNGTLYAFIATTPLN